MAWQVSPILVPLIAEVKNEIPGSQVVYTIGDSNHQSEVSDHNPDQWGFVCAADFMIGPYFSAADAERLFQRIRSLRDSRTAYVIYNRRIYSRTISPWAIRSYSGSDPHTNHVHVSVVHGSNPHPTSTWNVYPPPPPPPEVAPVTIGFEGTFTINQAWADQMGGTVGQTTTYGVALRQAALLAEEARTNTGGLDALAQAVNALNAELQSLTQDPADMDNPESHPIVAAVRYANAHPA